MNATNQPAPAEAWTLLGRARGVGLLIRVLIALGALAALTATLLAADRPPGIVEFGVIAASLICVVVPDSPLGLVVVALIAIEWSVTVDDVTTPWSIAVAGSLIVFHASLAAAGVVPPSARWTPAMMRRWGRRCLTLIAICPLVWSIVVVLEGRVAASSQALLAASVLSLAIAGVWARAGSLTAEPPAEGTRSRDRTRRSPGSR